MVVDGLEVSAQIRAAGASGLVTLANQLDKQFAKALGEIPQSVPVYIGEDKFSSEDFSAML